MKADSANPRVTRLLLAVTGVEAVVLFVAGLGLIAQPGTIAALWPWTLTPFNAAFLGGIYSASLASLVALAVLGR
ncbi:hypothetical protein BH10PSE9_BH10PSE9_18200 [soil metagenome]